MREKNVNINPMEKIRMKTTITIIFPFVYSNEEFDSEDQTNQGNEET